MTCCALPKNVPEGIHEILKTTAHEASYNRLIKCKAKGLFNQKKNQLQN
jgi:hypothetical protein